MSVDKEGFHVEQMSNVSRETLAVSVPNCPICNNNKHAFHFETRDYSISQEAFNIVQCTQCSFRRTWPIPANLNPYYDSEVYISHSKTKTGIINRLYHLAQSFNLRYKFSKVQRFTRGSQWIDYGSGAGDFLRYAKKRGVDISGVEPHEQSRTSCFGHNLQVITPESYLKGKQSAHAITMWHVLEHVPNLTELISKHYECLLPDGYLIIAVPNPASHDALIYKKYWAAWDVPRHLWHFEEKHIVALLGQHHFRHLKTYRMPFDAYYITMLSSKYKNGSIIKALVTAFISNLKSYLNLTPCSSQIYIFQKTPLNSPKMDVSSSLVEPLN